MRQVPRTFVDKISDAWQSSPFAVFLGAGAGLLFQLVLTMFTNVESLFNPSWLWWAWILAQNGMLIFRRQVPFLVLVAQCLLVVTAELLFLAGDFCLVPMLIAAFSVASRSRPALVAGGLLLCVVSYIPIVLAWDSEVGSAGFFPLLFYVGATMAVAFTFRFRRSILAERDAVLIAEDAALEADKRRRRADRSVRMAGNLHDSVGHNLTAIAAISEGLKGQTHNPEVEEALGYIDELARGALNDTREIVHAIANDEWEDLDRSSEHCDAKEWDDIQELVANVRRAGIAVAVVEHGARPDNPNLQNVCYAVIRESLTNVIRHGSNVTRVTISLEFDTAAVGVSVIDNGDNAHSSGDDSGLAFMRKRIGDLGGSLDAGPTGTGWIVHALIPTNRGTHQ